MKILLLHLNALKLSHLTPVESWENIVELQPQILKHHLVRKPLYQLYLPTIGVFDIFAMRSSINFKQWMILFYKLWSTS